MTPEYQLFEDLFKPMAVEIARLCEMSYRRGFHHGVIAAEDDLCDENDADHWRNDFDADCEFESPPPNYQNWRDVQCCSKSRISADMRDVRVAEELFERCRDKKDKTFPLLNDLFGMVFKHSSQREMRREMQRQLATSPEELAAFFDPSKFSEGMIGHKPETTTQNEG